MKEINAVKKEMVREMSEVAFISPEELARRWRMSRSGAVRLAERAGIQSVRLGGGKGATRRFRLADIQAHEKAASATMKVPGRSSSSKCIPNRENNEVDK